jgi:hypothetical protein
MKKTELKKFNCGTCSGLHNRKLVPGAKVNCSAMGHIASSKACPYYKPNVHLLTELNDTTDKDYDILDNLGQCLSKMTDTESTLIAAILLNSAATRKIGLNFWQKVYYKLGGTEIDDYVDCYVPCRVIDATRKIIRLIGERTIEAHGVTVTGKVIIEINIEKEGKNGSRKSWKCKDCTPSGCVSCKTNIQSALSGVLTVQQFILKRQELKATGKLKCPKTRNKSAYAPIGMPAIDYAVTLAEITDEFSTKKVKVSRNQDLVAIVGKMSRGVILNRRDSSYVKPKERKRPSSGELVIKHS